MSVAKAYAKALYEAACENKSTHEVVKTCDEIDLALRQATDLIHENRDLRIALEGPIVTAKEKMALVSELARRMSAPILFTRFLKLLAVKGRMPLLGNIAALFNAIRLEAEGGVPGQLVSAEPISDADASGLAEAFSRKLGKRVVFTVATDQELLAGVKVTVNGVTYDGTLRSQLEKMRDQFISAPAGRA